MYIILLLVLLLVFGLIIICYPKKNKHTSTSQPPSVVPSRNQRFSGKVVLVTGGTSGIGLATAIAFAFDGAAHVIVCGRQISKWQDIALPKIKTSLPLDMQSVIEYQKCDVRVENDVQNLIEGIASKYGRLDICFNNAGVAVGSPIQSQTLKSTESPKGLLYSLQPPQPTTPDSKGCSDPSLQDPTSPYCENPLYTDGIGVFNCLKYELIQMTKQLPSSDPPSIVNTASVNSYWGSPGGALYGASKAFVNVLTKGVGLETASASSGPIRINAICPGAVYTPLLSSQFGANSSYIDVNKIASAGVPMGRIALPEEIAPSVLFLSDNKMSSYITSSSLIIDGGLTAGPVL